MDGSCIDESTISITDNAISITPACFSPFPPPATTTKSPSESLCRVGSGNSVILDLESGVEAESRKLPSSKYKGVVPQPNGRWGAQIYEKHQRVWLGTFNEENEAARAYDIAAQRFRGRDSGANGKQYNNYGDNSYDHGCVRVLRAREQLFEKAVTPSDVGKLNRLVIPKQHAEKHFPLQSTSNNSTKGVLLNLEDVSGKVWRFRYSYWNSSQSYVLTKGWSRFVKEKNLKAGDTVCFQRSTGPDKQLYIDWKPRGGSSLVQPVQMVRLFGVNIFNVPGMENGCNGKRSMRDLELLSIDHQYSKKQRIVRAL
ncbi:hypothetical protein OIU76_011752 [Salix suchowensis]|nr:hypothetical protein OIU76_011752 [Salix suchowensis]